MNTIQDIIGFIKSLSYLDILFFFSVLILMLLVIILIYFIKENNMEDEDINLPKTPHKEEDAIVSLQEITQALEDAQDNEQVVDENISKYEAEQEEKAIISYEELIKRKNSYALNYVEENTDNDEVEVKQVDLNNLIYTKEEKPPKMKVSVISYEKEEAFLEALKALKETLN